MLESFLLGAAALLNNTPVFFEEVLSLPAETFEITTPQPWNAITLFTLDGTALPKLEYKNTENQWQRWGTEEDRNDLSELIFFEEPRTQLILKSETEQTVVAHFFHTHIPGENLLAQFSENTADFLESSPNSQSLLKKIPKYYLRADWGANESLRLAENFHSRTGGWSLLEERMVEPEFRPVNKIIKNDDGEYLYWPIAENQNIAKFVVHHTAENLQSERNRTPAELMRAIYSYHTITRGWGDIGYNFVIDRAGNVYEGRSGYERNKRIPVGAHVAYRNVGTVGIALMGNFQEEAPTDAQMDVLALLIADLSQQIGSDPLGTSSFWGKTTPNILGHRDLAISGHGTACPGRYFINQLPDLRTRVGEVLEILEEFEDTGVPKGKDFLSKSKAAPQVQKETSLAIERKDSPIEMSIITEIPQIKRNERKTISVKIKNNSSLDWSIGTSFQITNIPDGTIIEPLRTNELIRIGRTGTFSGKMSVKTTPNGTYNINLVPQFLEKKYFPEQIKKATLSFPFKVSGDTRLFRADVNESLFTKTIRETKTSIVSTPQIITSQITPSENETTEPHVKVKIAGFNASFVNVMGTKAIDVWHKGKMVTTAPAGALISVNHNLATQTLTLTVGTQKWNWDPQSKGQISLKTDGVSRIENYRNPQYGMGQTRYNSFRGDLHIYPQNERLLLVNELPVEEYLWGLGEEPSDEPLTKKHVIHILARSYATVYAGNKRKFNTYLYDLEDDPRTSQLYLGYDWERYHTEQKALVNETRGQLLTKDGKAVIGPYFTQSSGYSINPWYSQYPWCRVRELPYDKGLVQKGHGVGLSGNTARVLAKQGKTVQEIIDYFFEGLVVKKLY